MKNFFKNNWFKVSVVVLLFIITQQLWSLNSWMNTIRQGLYSIEFKLPSK
jgi:hypothetical protein